MSKSQISNQRYGFADMDDIILKSSIRFIQNIPYVGSDEEALKTAVLHTVINMGLDIEDTVIDLICDRMKDEILSSSPDNNLDPKEKLKELSEEDKYLPVTLMEWYANVEAYMGKALDYATIEIIDKHRELDELRKGYSQSSYNRRISENK